MKAKRKTNVIQLRRKPSEVEPLSDEALLAACASGDPNALAELFERLCDDVTRFIGRLAYVDAQDVEDLVQDVFLAVFRNATSYEQRSRAKTWVLAVAGNVARERCRKVSRGRKAREQLTEVPVVTKTSGEGEIVAKDLIEQVALCLPNLPHDLRVAFLMCDVEELPGIEVAGALGIPKGTLYRRLYDARRLLREALDGGPL